jgi:hypothetical protein
MSIVPKMTEPIRRFVRYEPGIEVVALLDSFVGSLFTFAQFEDSGMINQAKCPMLKEQLKAGKVIAILL